MLYGGQVRSSYTAPVLAALVTAAVPDADLTAIVGEPIRCDEIDAVVVRDARERRWAVWAPTTQHAALGLESQLDVLVHLETEHRAGHLLPDVVRPVGMVPLIGGGRALVARAPEGAPLTEDMLTTTPALAQPLARALASLHALNTRVIASTGMPDYSVAECRTRLHAEIDEAAESGTLPAVLFDRWEALLADDDLWRFTPRVVHGSLSAEALWFTGERISALTDFSRVHIGDPAEDLAWIVSVASDAFLEDFLQAYGSARRLTNPQALRTRATFMGEIALVRWLLHGLRGEDESVITDARTLLSELERAVATDEGADAPGGPADIDEDSTLTESVDMDEVLTSERPLR